MSSVFLEYHLDVIWSKVVCHFSYMDQDISLSPPLQGQQVQLLKTIPIIQSSIYTIVYCIIYCIILFRIFFSSNIRVSLFILLQALIFYNGKWDGKFHNQLKLLKFVLKYRGTYRLQIMGHGVMRSRWSVRSAGR